MVRRLLPLLLAAAGCRQEPPPVVKLPDFEMTAVSERSEKPFRRADMLGQVWVTQFVFTRCSGPCPLMTQRLKSVTETLPPEVRVLSVSVDPKGDTPERLRRFAGMHGLDPKRWVLVRGSVPDTYQLLFAGFRVPMSTRPKAVPEERVTHSTRFVLVDRDASVRGYYDALSDAGNAALARDARRLLEAGS